ncbi:hypothetical protein T01_2303 [Trichinella spiralis]|uniref:Uncharacterized protein n=1 Tax=Trichinella spiralis TaxID=6334 RepID=A0A0V1ALB9_TRISP|nr:hypothetical protein T01_2303 [Trichinella spiralis]
MDAFSITICKRLLSINCRSSLKNYKSIRPNVASTSNLSCFVVHSHVKLELHDYTMSIAKQIEPLQPIRVELWVRKFGVS